jgi:hypothetical protein
VSSRQQSKRGGLRSLGIGVLILSTIHIPLPLADYHNIRHHDGPGEICLHHNHLLRWHPSAGTNEDVSLLHWHWFLPLVEPGAHRPGTDEERPGPGPAMHAHLGDWPEPDWSGPPVIRPDGPGRFLENLALGLSGSCSGYLSAHLALLNPESGLFSTGRPDDVGDVRAARLALFQRWNC